MNQGMMSSWILRPFVYHFQEKTMGHLRAINDAWSIIMNTDNQFKMRGITERDAGYEYLASLDITKRPRELLRLNKAVNSTV